MDRRDPLGWAVRCMGVRRETIEWSLSDPERYAKHKWDSEIKVPGTTKWRPCRDPLKAVLDLLGRGVKRIVMLSSTGTGKTYLLGRIISPWFASVYPQESRTFGLAPREEQLKVGYWKELTSGKEHLDAMWPNIAWQKTAVYFNGEVDEDRREKWSIRQLVAGAGAAETASSRLKGLHDPNMLFIFEEMNGIQTSVIRTIKRTCTARNNIIIGVGNPESRQDALNESADEKAFAAVRVSSLDHPNIVLENDDFIPGAVTRDFIKNTILWSKEVQGDKTHPEYLVAVRGVTPVSSANCLYSSKVIEEVRNRNALKKDNGWVWKSPAKEKPVKGEHCEDEFGHRPYIRIYHPPENTHFDRYLLFADVAGEKASGDFHCVIVLDRVTRGIAAILRMYGPGQEYAREIDWLARYYSVPDMRPYQDRNYPMVAWETNGVGAQLQSQIWEGKTGNERFRDYPKLYHRESTTQDKLKVRSTLGWYTTPDLRSDMQDLLGVWGRELMYYPERCPDREFWEEMRTFVKKDTSTRYQAASGHHDDTQMAMAGALMVDNQRRLKGLVPVEKDDDLIQRTIANKSKKSAPTQSKYNLSKQMPLTFA